MKNGKSEVSEKEADDKRVDKAYSKLIDLGDKPGSAKPRPGPIVYYPSVTLRGKDAAALGKLDVGKSFTAKANFKVVEISEDDQGSKCRLEVRSMTRERE